MLLLSVAQWWKHSKNTPTFHLFFLKQVTTINNKDAYTCMKWQLLLIFFHRSGCNTRFCSWSHGELGFNPIQGTSSIVQSWFLHNGGQAVRGRSSSSWTGAYGTRHWNTVSFVKPIRAIETRDLLTGLVRRVCKWKQANKCWLQRWNCMHYNS